MMGSNARRKDDDMSTGKYLERINIIYTVFYKGHPQPVLFSSGLCLCSCVVTQTAAKTTTPLTSESSVVNCPGTMNSTLLSHPRLIYSIVS